MRAEALKPRKAVGAVVRSRECVCDIHQVVLLVQANVTSRYIHMTYVLSFFTSPYAFHIYSLLE